MLGASAADGVGFNRADGGVVEGLIVLSCARCSYTRTLAMRDPLLAYYSLWDSGDGQAEMEGRYWFQIRGDGGTRVVMMMMMMIMMMSGTRDGGRVISVRVVT